MSWLFNNVLTMSYTHQRNSVALKNIHSFVVITLVFYVIMMYGIQFTEGQIQNSSQVVRIKLGASVPNLQSSIIASYEPDTLPINTAGPGLAVNTTVTWINEDESFHTVTSGNYTRGPDKKFDSGLLPPKFDWNYTFSIPGKYVYYCTIHPYMEGSVRVGN
jgi:plastocyanin